MSDGTKIEWSEATWSPVTGCTKISDGCLNCYIERTPPFRMEHRRFNLPVIGGTTGVKLHSDRLGIPMRWRKPRRIFVCSLADLFHEQVPTKFIAEVFAVMSLTPQHTFQVLTKRHARLRSLLNSPAFRILVLDQAYLMAVGEVPGVEVPHKVADAYHRRWEAAQRGEVDSVLPGWPLPNVHLGVSVESQEWVDIRIPALLGTPAAVRWLSMEPLLGPVNLGRWLNCDCPAIGNPAFCHHPGCPVREGRAISWIVVGGESGSAKARPMHPQWARSIRDQCVSSGVPFFFKQWGEFAPSGAGAETEAGVSGALTLVAPDGSTSNPRLGVLAPAESAEVRRYGKKRAGRVLDGRTWDEYPDTSAGAVA